MVLIILLLLSPLAMFILHKKQTFYSIRRNGVISSSSGYVRDQDGSRQRNKNRQMYKVTHCIGLLHSCTLVIILNVWLTAVHNGYNTRS